MTLAPVLLSKKCPRSVKKINRKESDAALCDNRNLSLDYGHSLCVSRYFTPKLRERDEIRQQYRIDLECPLEWNRDMSRHLHFPLKFSLEPLVWLNLGPSSDRWSPFSIIITWHTIMVMNWLCAFVICSKLSVSSVVPTHHPSIGVAVVSLSFTHLALHFG